MDSPTGQGGQPRAATLCTKCKSLSFNDSDIRFKWLLRDEQGGEGKEYEARLDYEFRDSLPDLPALRHSASGCEFCAMLLHVILTEDESKADKRVRAFLKEQSELQSAIKITLRYSWAGQDIERQEDRTNRWLVLLAFLSVVKEDDQELVGPLSDSEMDGHLQDCISFTFVIEGLKGRHHERLRKRLRLPEFLPQSDRFNQSAVTWAKSLIDTDLDSSRANSEADTFLPDRLIDVQHGSVRLVSRANIDKDPHVSDSVTRQYSALSYCWGQPEQLLTTRNNTDEHSVSIPEERMSPLLRDAVQLTRLISIPYLWVDALCIIQDDPHDWEHQSSKMGLIYQSATVTIATPGTSSTAMGFRFSHCPKIHVSISSHFSPGISGLVGVRYISTSIGGLVPTTLTEVAHLYFEEVIESRWASRGWTFQEQALSCRILYFSAGDIFFANQSMVMHYATGEQSERSWPRFHVESVKDGGFSAWYHLIVAQYSGRSGQTRCEDVLPALSGIAERFARNMRLPPSDYLAGMWRGRLASDLAWYATDRGIKPRGFSRLLHVLRQPGPVMAPSWTWANRGRIESVENCMKEISQHDDCNMDAATTVKGQNMFGTVDSGVIRLTARMANILEDVGLGPDGLFASKGGHFLELSLDWESEEASLTGVKMALLGTGQLNEQKGLGFFGLLLHDAGQPHDGQFFRVGMFMTTLRAESTIHSGCEFFGDFPIQTVEIV